MLLTAHQVADVWVQEGGPASRVVEWCAISLAESGFRTDAVSVTGAIGLWQEEPEHAGEYGFQVSGLYDPQVNAYIAVRLSGHGTNCAAWDTAYLDIYASGRYSYLAFPERGSAAYNNLGTIANLLGRNPNYNVTTAIPQVVGAELPNTIERWQELGGRSIPSLTRTLLHERSRVQRLYTGG